MEWGDALTRSGNSPEAFEQARVIFDTARSILGKTPHGVRMSQPIAQQTVATFIPAFAPLNPRLLDLYDIVGDRLALIREVASSRRLEEGGLGQEIPYFGDDPVRHGWRSNAATCADEAEWCYLPSPYRFGSLIQKALDYAARAEQLGGALLAAFEKGDAEYLATLRSGHELELLTLGIEARKDQWRNADWQIEALQKGKAVSQSNWAYYNQLINAGPEGLINSELMYPVLTIAATALRSAGNAVEAGGGASDAAGNYFVGADGLSPVGIAQLPPGQPLGSAAASQARVLNILADVTSTLAGLGLTQAGWQRRFDEWNQQKEVLTIEIQQTERQILAAQRLRDQALVDLNSQRRQVEQSAEVYDFLRDKFTAQDLYLFLQKETAALYRQTYDLALEAAGQAQHAFNLERGHTTRRFVPECGWDSLHEGLMAGERLSAALRCMEKAYRDENVREYELTKNFSLRLHFPSEYLRLRTTGCCEIDIAEWMFDLDFPGHYMRRIKRVAADIFCVTGLGNNVNCSLTLLANKTRISPLLQAPAHECCCPPEPCCRDCREEERLAHEYEPCPDDPRFVRVFGARDAIATSIATSTGQNDSGLFELNFNDERYLPFEYMGAVSRWRIELPPENNYFDLETVSDVVLRLSYTAREGGERLRRAANEAAQRHLPGDGWRFLDVRHEFPDAWQLFRDSLRDGRTGGSLKLRLDRKLFPFVPGACKIHVDRLAIVFGSEQCQERSLPAEIGCPCPEEGIAAHHVVKFSTGRDDYRSAAEVRCMAGDQWPHLYFGACDVDGVVLGRRDYRAEVAFRFPADSKGVDRIFLLCRYGVVRAVDRGHPRSTRFPL